MTRRYRFSRPRNPAQPRGINRGIQPCGITPPLHFDEGDGTAPARDEINLAHRQFHPLCDDAPALKPQPPCGKVFSTPPAPLGLCASDLTIHPFSSPLISSARA